MYRTLHHIVLSLSIAAILGGVAACLAHAGSSGNRPAEADCISMIRPTAISTFIPFQEENMELTSTGMTVSGAPQNAQRTPEIQGIRLHPSAVQGMKTLSDRHYPDISDACPRLADYFVFALERILV